MVVVAELLAWVRLCNDSHTHSLIFPASTFRVLTSLHRDIGTEAIA